MVERYNSLTFDELPSDVVTRAKESVLDQVGCMFGGSVLESTATVLSLTADLGGVGQSTLVDGRLASAPWAALVNATSGHGVELDDTDNASSSHPGNVIVPVALALAELTGASGRDLIVAVVAGYDAMLRIGRAAGPQAQYERGFHPTATCGVFGSAVSSSLLLGLTADQQAQALGIAGSYAAGSLEYITEGSWSKRLQVGAAAQNGIIASLLAKRGFTGPTTILEGRFGFLRAYAGVTNTQPLIDGLDRPFSITGVSIKAFACCRYCQAPVDGLLQLRDRVGFGPDDVEWVDVGLVSAGRPIVAEPREEKLNPRNPVDAQFSLPYSIAVALARGKAFLEEFSPDAINDPAVRRLMPLVRTHQEDQLDAMYPGAWPARVTVGLRDGRRPEILLTDCRGDPSRPLSWDELVDKFDRLANPHSSQPARAEFVNAVTNLTERDDVGSLIGMLARSGNR